MRINQITENIITLNDLYDWDELNDESEMLYHWTTPENHDMPFTVKTMQPEQIKQLKTPINDMTILNAYNQFAGQEQKQLVKDKIKNYDKNRITVIANETVIDGNHHLIAAILSNNPAKYIDIYDEPESE